MSDKVETIRYKDFIHIKTQEERNKMITGLLLTMLHSEVPLSDSTHKELLVLNMLGMFRVNSYDYLNIKFGDEIPFYLYKEVDESQDKDIIKSAYNDKDIPDIKNVEVKIITRKVIE